MSANVIDTDTVHRRIEVRIPESHRELAKLELCDCYADGRVEIDKLYISNTFLHSHGDKEMEETARRLRALAEWAEKAADVIEEENNA